jgi:hypothetical protein
MMLAYLLFFETVVKKLGKQDAAKQLGVFSLINIDVA